MHETNAIEASLNAKIFNLFALNKAAQVLTSVLDPRSLTEMAVDVATEMGRAKSGALYVAGGPGESYRLAGVKSLDGGSFASDLGSAAAIARRAGSLKSRPFLSPIPGRTEEGLIVPVHLGELLVGFFMLLDRMNPEPWSQDDFEVLETLAAHVAVCLQNARLYKKVTEQYEALEVAQARRVQTEKLATMGTLLAGVAHELNNPLSVILGHTAILCQTSKDESLRARAGKIASASERCARIVKNFLAIARERPPERESVSLHQVVEEAVELLAYHLRSDGVDVVMALADDVPALWADPHQLHQVVVNLVSNAHHAMRKSPPPRTITVTSRFEPARALVRLEVADTGPGVPPEVRSRIFDPFFTTKPTGEGTGLGLSLCQGIIEGHAGSIWLADSTGRGAVFVIELPAKETPATVQSRAERDLSTTIGGRVVLIIDDEPEILELLVDVLRSDGLEAETACSGASAKEKLRERTFDLVLSDVRMPELDGAGLYRELERIDPNLTSRFVFMTGDSLSAETRQFIERVGALSLSKPFSPDEVRRVVRRALERAEDAQR
ncbi:MAG: hypothetical protein DME17_20455 [Candidatus Rokuibacteriota bacterium]|nr:MAG: hypothetical protein DME17_20455 [Candidatus Rokubacteria bacterium]